MLGTFRSELFKMTTTRATKVLLGFAVILPVIIFTLTLIYGFQDGVMGSPAVVNIASCTTGCTIAWRCRRDVCNTGVFPGNHSHHLGGHT